MKNGLLTVFIAFLLVFNASAANILVWNFNPEDADEFTDPEAGEKIDCGYWLKECITADGKTFDYHDNTSLPADINSYDIIIATLGYYVC